MSLKPFKIKVESKSHSREIQEWLSSLGYTWEVVGNIPQAYAHFLIFSKKGESEEYTIRYGHTLECFNKISPPEMWFYDGKLQDKPQTHPLKEEVLMNSTKTYREVAEALLKGKELQSLDSGRWIPITYLGIDVRYLDNQYPRKVRDKPRNCNGVELDPCLTKHHTKGIYYYYPDPMHVDYYGSKLWNDDADDIYWFELGFAYATKESAAKHGQAMGLYMDSCK